MKENRRSNARTFDQGLLVTIQKSIVRDIKRNNSDKETFAAEIGLTKGTLENKWTFSCKTNDFTIHELIQIMELTGDITPLEYIGHMFDMAVISTNTENTTTIEMLNKLADESQIQSNESFAVVKRASADGVYTVEEIAEMKRETLEAIEAKQRELEAIGRIRPVDLEE
jgi:hypothetical protein